MHSHYCQHLKYNPYGDWPSLLIWFDDDRCCGKVAHHCVSAWYDDGEKFEEWLCDEHFDMHTQYASSDPASKRRWEEDIDNAAKGIYPKLTKWVFTFDGELVSGPDDAIK